MWVEIQGFFRVRLTEWHDGTINKVWRKQEGSEKRHWKRGPYDVAKSALIFSKCFHPTGSMYYGSIGMVIWNDGIWAL